MELPPQEHRDYMASRGFIEQTNGKGGWRLINLYANSDLLPSDEEKLRRLGAKIERGSTNSLVTIGINSADGLEAFYREAPVLPISLTKIHDAQKIAKMLDEVQLEQLENRRQAVLPEVAFGQFGGNVAGKSYITDGTISPAEIERAKAQLKEVIALNRAGESYKAAHLIEASDLTLDERALVAGYLLEFGAAKDQVEDKFAKSNELVGAVEDKFAKSNELVGAVEDKLKVIKQHYDGPDGGFYTPSPTGGGVAPPPKGRRR